MGNSNSKVDTSSGESKVESIQDKSEIEEEFKSLPEIKEEEVNMRFVGWWSETGKPEPSSNGNNREKKELYSALAIHIKPDGKYFFRDHSFSARGTFYGGKWRPKDGSDDEILLYNNYKDNMKMKTISFYVKGSAKIQSNGDIEVNLCGKHRIPYVMLENSSQKSARSVAP